jgi:uncharacterized protein YejL (UPF0352 family)
MPTSLQSQLQQLATTFADSVLAAIRATSLDELVGASGASAAPRRGATQGFRKPVVASAPTPAVAKRMSSPKSSGRLARRSPEQIRKIVDQVVALVKKHKDGLRAEQIRVELGLLAKEMPRVLKDGVAAKKLASKGQKRATTYLAK